MVCNQCGHQVADGTKYCPACGNDLAAQAQQAQAQQAQIVQQSVYYQQQPQSRESKYDGSVLDTFLAFLAASLLMSLTCGIALPWALCYLYKFVISHIIIDGKRLSFDGTGAQLFGNWIKWFVFIVITCGIYSFWVYPRLFDWVAKHTHFDVH